MPPMNRFLRYLLVFFGVLLALLLALFIYVKVVTDLPEPDISNERFSDDTVLHNDGELTYAGNHWLRKSRTGLWEMYVEGNGYQRGVMHGRLARHLVQEQEEAFSERINEMVPSGIYRRILSYLIAWFNRDLHQYIPLEYKKEIFGISQYASPEFEWVGPAYQRLMNYHAAHDIGHALQNMALVGCSSFGVWNERTEDSTLLIGRNFDFYVGDHFAENKIVMFVNPDSGHQFMMVTWGGMIGVVSGMNMQGLTITLNAAKSEIPTGSATPVSILAREVLQYASTIDEALKIIRGKKTFVSESFLIGSAKDGKAVNIEITPDTVDIYETGLDQIVCTNHYDGPVLEKTESNLIHKKESASVYRQQRLTELVSGQAKLNPQSIANILRNPYGLNDRRIGYGHEKAVNQFISHHSVIFDPMKKIVWVSTTPWQLGAYVAYRLDSIFARAVPFPGNEIYDSTLTIPADPFVNSPEFRNFVMFRQLRDSLIRGYDADPYRLIELNPYYYDAYRVSGDYLFVKKKLKEAATLYSKALTKEIANKSEEDHIREKLRVIGER